MAAYEDFLAALDQANLEPRDVVSITGFRLDGSRLYLDEHQLSWIDIADDGVVHTREHGEADFPLGLITIWVRREAETTFGQVTNADYAAAYLKPSSFGSVIGSGWEQVFRGPGGPSPVSTLWPCPLSGRGPCMHRDLS